MVYEKLIIPRRNTLLFQKHSALKAASDTLTFTQRVDRGMTITDVKLLEKQGGKSGHWVSP
jgi:molybdenum cofactor biosynthesis enzyme